MIIGIDETGNFDPNSKDKQFFTAVSIDQNNGKALLKQKQFLEWESTIPEANREGMHGEVKGRNLTSKQIHEFFFDVLIKPPRSYFVIVEFDPSENPIDLVEKHKRWNLSQMEHAMYQHQKANQPNWAKGYMQMIAWYGKSNYHRVAKLENLQNLYCFAIHQGFYYGQILCVLDNYADSNFDFRIKIDKDFIRSKILRDFWDVYMYNFWQTFCQTRGLELIDDDPLLRKALTKHFEIKGSNLILQDTFYGHTMFKDSHEHFEIRMADILGNILHRYHNKGQCQSIWKVILQILLLEENFPLYTKAKFKKGDPPAS
jgi:hypothetical protein